MDPSEERLREVLAAVGGDLWSLIDTAIAVATRDHPSDLRARREGIVESLYALTPCRNCDPNRCNSANGHGAYSNRANGHGSLGTRANGDGSNINTAHRTEASPEMRSVSPSPSPELELRHAEEEEENSKEIDIRELIMIKEILEDPAQQADEEGFVCFLRNLADMNVTYEALQETDIGHLVSSLRRNGSSEEVRQLAKLIISKWKVALMKNSSACGSSSPTVPSNTENGSPQKIPTKSRNHHNSNGPNGFMRSPKKQTGVGSSERSGSDSLHSKAGGSSSRREAPTRPGTSNRSSTPPVAPPAKGKEKEKEESASDQARLDSARKRLQENYREANDAKKQRTVQVMSLNEIPKPKAPRKFGSTSRNR